MQFVHFGHSCVLAETASARLLFDPGIFSKGFEEVRDLTAILITHQHFDHLDEQRLPALVAANPGVRLIVDPASAENRCRPWPHRHDRGPRRDLPGGRRDRERGQRQPRDHPPGDPGAAEQRLRGRRRRFYHPGDSFFRPAQTVDVLGLPTGAPWQKLSEAWTTCGS